MPEGQTDVGQVPYIVPQRSAAPRLLFHPAKADDEGPCGYTMRLADRNRVSVSDIYGLLGSESLGFFSGGVALARGQALALLAGRARCCPHCLVSRKRWMSAWEIAHADACPDCGHWLVDQCSRCSKPLSWARPRLLECQCGNSLITERQGEAPAVVVALAATLFSIHRGDHVEAAPLARLGLADAVDAIRFLGSLAAGVPRSRVQSEYRLDPLETSWTVTTGAAEVMKDWPYSLWTLLDRIRERQSEDHRGQLLRLFSPVYVALYRHKGADKLDAIKQAFEAYLVQRWPGQLAKRHRRLNSIELPEPYWLRVSQAVKLCGWPKRSLLHLVQAGELSAQAWTTSGGRTYMLLKRDEVDELARARGKSVDLSQAAQRLGLSEPRASSVLSQMTGVVPPLWVGGRWHIPEKIIIDWESYIEKLPASFVGVKHLVTLKDAMKYIIPDSQSLLNMLMDIEDGKLRVVGKMPGLKGLNAITFDKLVFEDWRQKQSQKLETIPIRSCVDVLKAKEQVVYEIARKGLLKTVRAQVGRRMERHTTMDWILEFKQQYVFASQLAKSLQTSARRLHAILLDEGVVPTSGPGVDACRQLIYDRPSVEKVFEKNGLKLPKSD